MQLTSLKALALQALQCNQPCNQPATLELHNQPIGLRQGIPICNPPEASEKLGGMEPKQRFRDWWWDEFDCGTDSAEFNAGSPEATSELLLLLRNLVWPDFKVEAVGAILKLKRVAVRHYPASDVPDEDA